MASVPSFSLLSFAQVVLLPHEFSVPCNKTTSTHEASKRKVPRRRDFSKCHVFFSYVHSSLKQVAALLSFFNKFYSIAKCIDVFFFLISIYNINSYSINITTLISS